MLDDPWQCITICCILTFSEAMITAGETGIFTVSEVRLEQLIATGRDRARLILSLQQEREAETKRRFQLSHYLLHLLLGAATVHCWALPVGVYLQSYNIPKPSATLMAFVLVLLPLMTCVFVLGHLLPRRWALSKPEAAALMLAHPLNLLLMLLRPLDTLLYAIYRGIAFLFGDKGLEHVDEITEEEIKAFVAEHGSIAEEEKDLIHSVFEFGDVSVSKLMVPRIDIEALEETSTVSEAMELFRESGYSRIPVYRETIDCIVGIVNLKAVLNAWMEGKGEANVCLCMDPAVIAPEQKMALELLNEMQRSRKQMVIIKDEFGGTAGLATIEDLVEQLVGEIRDETDSDEVDEINSISATEVEVLGLTPVHGLNDEMDWNLPESDDYDTVGGLVFSLLGRIPSEGESVEVGEYHLLVKKMDRHRIELLQIYRKDPEAANKAGAKDEAEIEDESCLP